MLVVLVILLSGGIHAQAQRRIDAASSPFAGRSLEDALRVLRTRGLKIIFSTELVRPDMRVTVEPHAAPLRETLDALLAPHRLIVREGPRGLLLIVPAPAPPLPRRHVAPPVAPVAAVARPRAADAASAGGPDAGAAMSFSEVIAVAEQPVGAERGGQALGRRELEELRGAMSGDPLRAVQALPGVAATDDFNSGFSVRGADPRRVGMSIDGVSTPWLVQVIGRQDRGGSVALLNSDIVDSLALSPGLFSPQYGDRTAGWLDATIREGDRGRIRMRGVLSGTGLDYLAEGPLTPGSRGSWLTALRHNQMGWPLALFTAQEPMDFGFTDVQTKVVLDLTPRHQLHTSVVVGHSFFNERQPTAAGDGWHHALLATWGLQSTLSPSLVVSQRGAVISQGVTATGRLDSSTPDNIERVDLAREWYDELSYRTDAAWAMRPSLMLETGFSGQWKGKQTFRQWPLGMAPVAPLPPAPLPPVSDPETLRASAGPLLSGYAQLAWQGRGGLSITPSLRATHASIIQEGALLPAVRAAWAMTNAVTLHASAGLQWQAPEIDQVLGAFGAADLRGERSRQMEAGFEARLRPRLRAQVTVYDRRDTGLLRLENSEHRLVGNTIVPPSLTPRYANALDGGSRGVELSLRRDGQSRVTGWISYAYGRTRYTDVLQQESFWGDFDQRHTMNLYGHFRVTSATSLAAKFRYGSNVPLAGYYTVAPEDGLPFGAMPFGESSVTATMAQAQAASMLPPTLMDREEFLQVRIGEKRNELRLPAYARLDLRVNQRFTLRKRSFSVYLEALNVLNRVNVRARPRDAWSDALLGSTEPLIRGVVSGGLVFEF